MARLSIRLLGPLQVTLDGEPVTGFESDKVRALLAYLAVEQGAPQRREKLAGMLWPDWPERSARTNLRRALANLRKALGDHQAAPPFLHISHQAIQFNRTSDAWVDVIACQDPLSVYHPQPTGAARPKTEPQAIPQMEEVVALYRGDFLEGFSLAGCPAFEEWMLFEEERLRRLTLEALDHLSGWYERQGRTDRALQHARRQVELDPLRESAHRQIMRLLACNGQRGVALAQYETCRRILAEELGVEPGAETRRLYEQIRDGECQRSALAPAPIPGPELAARSPIFLAEETAEILSPVFVAREREVARLKGFLDGALAGDGQVVFVTGGPGRGKTALLDEFARRAMETHDNLLAASGNCNAYSGVGDPYLPFRDVMGLLTGDIEARWAAGAISRDHALRLWGALPQAVQALLDHGPHLVPALVPGPALLARSRAVAPAGAPWLDRLTERVERGAAHSEAKEQSHLFQQVTNLLRALAEVHPLLLILDDLQWADTASVGLLFHLGRRLAGSRILVAGAYRPEEVALGRAGERHPLETVLAEFKRAFGDVWLDLAEVPALEGRHFLDALLETEPNLLGEEFRKALFELTGGHPLFTVELLRAMQERGDLVQDERGCWVEGPTLRWDTLPARVEGVIEARVGRLEAELRELLSVASVEGEEFTAQVVARVQGIGQRQVLQRLSQELGKRHRLVREQSALHLGRQWLSRYRFAHTLFQQYLYHHLGDGERALLHGEVAAVLEELYQGHPEGVGAIAPQLARHFAEAGDEGCALRYLILAGDGALAAYANGEAEAYYRRALELAPGESERADLLSGLGEVLLRQSRFREAIQTWGEGIDLYGALADRDRLAHLYARAARAADLANDPAEALRLCLEGLARVEGAPESPGLAGLLYETACAYAWNALGKEARSFAPRALKMAERLGDVEVQAHALATPGLLGLPSVEDRWQALTRAAELAESHGLLEAAGRAHSSLATLALRHRGDYHAARQHLHRAAELYGQAGDTAGQVLALDEQASCSISCGELEEVRRTISQMRALLNDLAEPTYAAQAVRVIEAWYFLFRGEWAECARRARALRTAARERGDDPELAGAGSILAIAVLESGLFGGDAGAGTWEEAEAACAEHIEINDRSLNVHGSIYGRAFLGLLRLAQGRPGAARRLLAEARQKAREGLALPEDEGFLHWLAALVLGAEGNWAEALAAHEAAAELFARYGLRFHWARFHLDWAEAHAARGEPGDRERAQELLRETQAAFEEMGSSCYVVVAQERLQEMRAAEGAATRQTLEP